MKIKTGKRAFAALIAVVMVLGMFPLAALADGNTVAIDTTEGTGTTYDPVAKSIILKAGISEASADVTVLAIKCDSEITLAELNALTPEDLANKIAYINQVESDSEGKVNMTFKLRELDGDYVTVAVGGEGVTEPKVCSFSTKKAAATFDVADYYIAGEEIAFNVTDANGWIAANKIVKVDDDVVDSGVVFEGTTMTLGDPLVFDLVDDDLGEPVAEKTFALTIETEEHSTISKEIKVVAPTKVAYDELLAAGNPSLAYMTDGVEDKANGAALVTLPAIEYAGANLTWTFNPADATVDGNVATLVRPDANAAEDTLAYTITATIEAADYKKFTKDYTVTVKKLGLAGPNIVESEVTVNTATEAFGSGANMVVINTAETINVEDEKVVIGGIELFWSPARGKFVGTVSGYADAAALLADLDVVAGASTKLYYGNVDDPTTESATCDIFDVMAALALKNGANPSATPAQWLAADVSDGNGTIDIFDVMAILTKKNVPSTVFYIEQN